MKRNKVLAALLAGALVMTSAALPNSVSVKAEKRTLEDGLVASYDFNDMTLTNKITDQGQAEAVITKLGAYGQDLVYQAGAEGKGQALKLGDYGLKLNQPNIGDNFTVSMWLKPNDDFVKNEAVMFLGHHAPEKWLAVAGPENPGPECKFWTNGSGNGQNFGWTSFGTMNIDASWHCLTVTGSNDGAIAYLDGKEIAKGGSIAPLTGENQDVYIGVTNWDDEFDGLVDDIKVYNRKLSAGEVAKLYNPEISPEEVLSTEGITATKALNMVKDRTEQIEVKMPAVVKEANPAVTYESGDSNVAAVDGNGLVTAKGEGSTTITTSVTLGRTTKTAETQVNVSGSVEGNLVAQFDFNDNLDNSVQGSKAADAVVKGLSPYNGQLQYKEGHSGQAVQLGDYGLRLNQKNIGTDYTVSMWVKADQGQLENQCMLFLGHHNPEQWLAVAGAAKGGDKRSENYKVWGNGNEYQGHTTLYEQYIRSREWHQITLTGTTGKVKLYIDGICLGEKQGNDPLAGENQDIYLGVNNWDEEFEGLVDEVKVYRIALTENEVQGQAKDEFQKILAARIDENLEVRDILGENSSEDEIKSNLVLPASVDGLNVTWTSNKESVIGADGSLKNVEKEQEVTLTAEVKCGELTYSKAFRVKVAAIDTSELKTLLEEAKKVDTTYLTEESKTRLEKAIKEAEEALKAPMFASVEKAYTNLDRAMTELYYVAIDNPFDVIAEPKAQTSLKVGTTEKLFEIPAVIQDVVTVEYSSEKEDVAVYNDGVVEAKGEGKTIVTATVTSEALKFAVEYATAVEVTSDEPPLHTHDLTKVDKKEPTCTSTGNIEYWYCEGCGKYFSDKNAATQIEEKDTVLPMKEHEWESDYTVDKEATATEDGSKSIHCKNCTAKKDVQVIPATGKPGSVNPDNDSQNNGGAHEKDDNGQQTSGSVKTGDTANVGALFATMAAAIVAAGAVLLGKKRR